MRSSLTVWSAALASTQLQLVECDRELLRYGR